MEYGKCQTMMLTRPTNLDASAWMYMKQQMPDIGAPMNEFRDNGKRAKHLWKLNRLQPTSELLFLCCLDVLILPCKCYCALHKRLGYKQNINQKFIAENMLPCREQCWTSKLHSDRCANTEILDNSYTEMIAATQTTFKRLQVRVPAQHTTHSFQPKAGTHLSLVVWRDVDTRTRAGLNTW